MYRIIYSALFYLAVPLILIRLFIRSLQAPDYRKRIAERFGWIKGVQRSVDTSYVIWIHAVSVGETVAAAPLVDALRKSYPKALIAITTMTPTGSARVQSLFGENVFHSYVPYDLPGALSRFTARVKPDLLILMETELWPNMIHHCHQKGIKLLLANARLSEKSALSYGRFPAASQAMLAKFDFIAAQGQADANRFISLGASKSAVSVTGSLKFQVALDSVTEAADDFFTSIKASGRPVLIAASTRDGEEQKVLQAFSQCLRAHPNLLLMLVPRHPERFDKVARLCEQKQLVLTRRSQKLGITFDAQVCLGDSMGEMLAYYQLATIAFVGGSLVNTGCQNVLEPAALGIPVVTGPSQFNFATICIQLEQAGALQTVQDEQALADFVIALLNEPVKQQAMGQAGKILVRENQNALPALMGLLEKLFPAAK